MARVQGQTLRQRQSQETRIRIISQARSLFAKHGYGATTIADIASAAGVAIPTIYKIFRNKPGLLEAIVESWRAEFIPGGLGSAPGDAAEAIAWWARTARRQWETGYDIATIFASAVTAEPGVREELARRLTFRSAAVRHVAEAAASRPGALRSASEAAAIISGLTIPEVYRELVLDHGWTADQYERWVNQTLTEQLLPTTSS